MPRQETIKNDYGEVLLPKRFEKKYLKFIEELSDGDPLAGKVSEAIKSKDVGMIEAAALSLANGIRTNGYLLGLICLVIERERIYRKAGYGSYLEYSQTLFAKLELSNQSLSNAKNIMGAYLDHRAGLDRHGFRFERNAQKLKHIDEAMANHGEDMDGIYERAAKLTYREFAEWAQAGRKALPPPVPRVKIVDGKITVAGRKYEELPEAVRKTIEQDITEICTIRSDGSEPVVVPAYDAREARLLKRKVDVFLKEIREKR